MAEAPARPPSTSQPDAAARRRIAEDLDATLFVEAGAGSGKTTALVERVVALVVHGGVELASIAAITFTEKAGAELGDRIRRALEERSATSPGPVAERCALALDQLDGAAVGTLHAFAQRLLREHPLEAGLPPRVEVLDEVSSGVEFERRWATFRDALLADPQMERTIVLLLAAGVGHPALRALAAAFDANWDLVAERVPAHGSEPPPVRDLLAQALPALDAVCARRGDCTDATDLLCQRIDEVAAYAERLRGIDDEVELLEALAGTGGVARPRFSAGNVGRKAAWRRDHKGLRAELRAAGEELDAVLGAVTQACAHRLASAIRHFTLGAAEERRAEGRLEFHDLLVMARALLRDPHHGPAVRTRLHHRYRRLLLDELQDTDPIQVELAARIAAVRPGAAETSTCPWDQLEVRPGHLFMVGDPKQSIYRFRRADIAVFLAAQARFGGDGGHVGLTANFRTARPILEWVNHVFAALMGEPPEVDLPVASQPAYVALDPVHPAPGGGPAVALIGRTPHGSKVRADELRQREASEVVASVIRARTEGWSVRTADGGERPVRLGDVAILVPARTSLPFLEDRLDEAGIAYRAESSSLVYATRAVRDLLMVLRAVADPTDHLRIVAALRTPLLACGDDDLFRFKVERRGRWSYLASQPDSVPVDDPVRAGFACLRALHERRQWSTPAELLGRIAEDRRAFELGFAEGRPRDVWRRLRFVIDQARAWSEATGGSLRQYLHWVELQTAEGARVAESVLPETDDDAVRILTIHAAKGLEFPVVIVSGMSTVPQGRRAAAEVVFPAPGGVGYRFGQHVATQEYTDWKPVDEQMGFDERIRLLYVACTRARDHLVVSLHRRARAAPAGRTTRTNAELLVDGTGAQLDELPDGAEELPGTLPAVGVARPEPVLAFEVWEAEREAILARAARPTTVAATALSDEGRPDVSSAGDREEVRRDAQDGDGAGDGEGPDAGLRKRPYDLDLPPWLKGRYGSAVGRAVHGVLQRIDLASGAGLEPAVAAQCQAEAVPERHADVRLLVGHALASASVREAAGRPHWREVYACTPVGDRLLEGYVDLLYRGDDGLVVVDYKTAGTSDPDELDRRVGVYRLQGASYALAVAVATGEAVVRVTFVFLTPHGAVERPLPDLDVAVAEADALVAAGGEVTVG